MSWRDRAWEFAVNALSWIVAIGALAFVVALVAYDAAKARRRRTRS